jgi:hypothetical protein
VEEEQEQTVVKEEGKETAGEESGHVEGQSSSSSAEDDLAAALQAAMLARRPDPKGHWLRDEFEQRLAKLPVPEFYDESATGVCAGQPSQEQLVAQLQKLQYALKVQTANLESQLLAEAGVFVSKTNGNEYNFPACLHGSSCVGMQHRLRGQSRGFILTMMMFDFEYSQFVEHGRVPRVQRPCVLCTRYHLTSLVVISRHVRMCGDSKQGDSVLPLDIRDNRIRQPYQNLCDQKGGYHRKHMLLTSHMADDPLYGPMVLPSESAIFVTNSDVLFHKTKKEPRLVVDQSALVWTGKTMPIPQIGQNLLSFCGGASRK